ncbi:hypothetical protein MTO96_049769 [Rhipicephalus appendiculatus]
MKVQLEPVTVSSLLIVVDHRGPLLCGRDTIQAFRKAGMFLLEGGTSSSTPLSSSGIHSTSSEALQAGLSVPGKEASGGGIEPASPGSTAEPILLRRSIRARKPPARF